MDELAPVINDLNRPFWEGAERRELLLPFCRSTGRHFWPPSPRSPFDIDQLVEWRPASPAGVLLVAVVYRRSFMKSLEPVMPYAIGQVELDCGPRLLVHLRDITLTAPECAGTRVEIHFDSILATGPKMPMARPLREH